MSDLIRRDDALKAVGLGQTYTKIKADIGAIPAVAHPGPDAYQIALHDAIGAVCLFFESLPSGVRWDLPQLCDAIMECARNEAVPQSGAWEPPAAWADVVAERRRQIEVEGWRPARDDAYTSGELARAGAAYAAASTYYHADPFAAALSIWPWDRKWLKPTTPRRDLVKAAALLLAEIERLDRLPPAPAGEGEG